jgi:putative intracellular protease/amidase
MSRIGLLLFALLLVAPLTSSASDAKSILMVVTSHSYIDNDHPTGIWLEEFAVPFELFTEAGYHVTVASPRGGKAPLDPRSTADAETTYQPDTLFALQDTIGLAGLDLSAFDAVFFPGGHGTMFDLPDDEAVAAAASYFIANDKPSAFICHGPAALVNATLPDGTSVVAGRTVTGFTNAEEDAVQLTDKMPFLLETRLKELGAEFSGADNFVEHIVTDGNLITGQNPASSKAAAQALLKQLDL